MKTFERFFQNENQCDNPPVSSRFGQIHRFGCHAKNINARQSECTPNQFNCLSRDRAYALFACVGVCSVNRGKSLRHSAQPGNSIDFWFVASAKRKGERKKLGTSGQSFCKELCFPLVFDIVFIFDCFCVCECGMCWLRGCSHQMQSEEDPLLCYLFFGLGISSLFGLCGIIQWLHNEPPTNHAESNGMKIAISWTQYTLGVHIIHRGESDQQTHKPKNKNSSRSIQLLSSWNVTKPIPNKSSWNAIYK